VELPGLPQASRTSMDAPNSDDVAIFVYTSEPQASPNACRLPLQRALVIAQYRRALCLTPADRSLVVLPLFHGHGLIGSTLSTLASGGSLILPPRFSAPSSGDSSASIERPGIPLCRQFIRCSWQGRQRRRAFQRPALHPLVFGCAGADNTSEAGESLSSASHRSIRNDRGVASGCK